MPPNANGGFISYHISAIAQLSAGEKITVKIYDSETSNPRTLRDGTIQIIKL